jgi:hypothetical protein
MGLVDLRVLYKSLRSSLTVVNAKCVLVLSTNGMASRLFVKALSSFLLLNLAIAIASVDPVTS